MRITLRRFREDQYGTHGALFDEIGNVLCFTEERPYKNNQEDTSCIPLGIYSCIDHDSADHPDSWEITGVKDRTGILIHNGNTMKDTKGCILVGLRRIPAGVLESVKAMEKLREFLPSTFTLEVISTPIT